MVRQRLTAIAASVAFLLSTFSAPAGWSYTQSGAGTAIANGIPMGHEWVTRKAAIELLGYANVVPDVADPNDPRRTWTRGRAFNTNLSGGWAQGEVQRIKAQAFNDSRYLSRYKAVYDAIIGERWVDIAGYNVLGGKVPGWVDCWDAVAQEPVEVQWDHFMRRYDEAGGDGGRSAADNSQTRFINYFVAAAMAPQATISVYDGGAAGSTAVDVDRNYFLFGRSAHLFEDSFSSEHTVRMPGDNYISVKQVKSYLCARGSEQHSHSESAVFDYSSGDVIWKKGTGLDPSWNGYKPSNMKDSALVAMEATKDLWAAFIRTMGTPIAQRQATAQQEARALVTNWLTYNRQELTTWYDNQNNRDATYVKVVDNEPGRGQTQKQCMANLKVGTDDQMTRVRQLQADQRKCIYNAIPWPGYEDLADTSMNMYFSWQWRNKLAYDNPPQNWNIPILPADTGVQVRVKSVANQQYLDTFNGVAPDIWVYAKAGGFILDFTVVGPKTDAKFRLRYAPQLFLSYAATTGAVKLWAPGSLSPTNYQIAPAGPGWSIKNIFYSQYMNLNTTSQSPYINSSGNPGNANSQWMIDGLR